MDSGIKVEAKCLEEMQTFKEIKKSVYDYMVMTIEVDPNAPPPKGKTKPAEHVAVYKTVPKGECEQKYEGQDLSGVPAIYQGIMDLINEEFKDKPCMVLLYLAYEIPGQGPQEKFVSICWNPDAAPMSLKMRYSATFKTVNNKAPKLNASMTCNDLDDMKYKNIVNEVSSGKCK